MAKQASDSYRVAPGDVIEDKHTKEKGVVTSLRKIGYATSLVGVVVYFAAKKVNKTYFVKWGEDGGFIKVATSSLSKMTHQAVSKVKKAAGFDATDPSPDAQPPLSATEALNKASTTDKFVDDALTLNTINTPTGPKTLREKQLEKLLGKDTQFSVTPKGRVFKKNILQEEMPSISPEVDRIFSKIFSQLPNGNKKQGFDPSTFTVSDALFDIHNKHQTRKGLILERNLAEAEKRTLFQRLKSTSVKSAEDTSRYRFLTNKINLLEEQIQKNTFDDYLWATAKPLIADANMAYLNTRHTALMQNKKSIKDSSRKDEFLAMFSEAEEELISLKQSVRKGSIDYFLGDKDQFEILLKTALENKEKSLRANLDSSIDAILKVSNGEFVENFDMFAPLTYATELSKLEMLRVYGLNSQAHLSFFEKGSLNKVSKQLHEIHKADIKEAFDLAKEVVGSLPYSYTRELAVNLDSDRSGSLKTILETLNRDLNPDKIALDAMEMSEQAEIALARRIARVSVPRWVDPKDAEQWIEDNTSMIQQSFGTLDPLHIQANIELVREYSTPSPEFKLEPNSPVQALISHEKINKTPTTLEEINTILSSEAKTSLYTPLQIENMANLRTKLERDITSVIDNPARAINTKIVYVNGRGYLMEGLVERTHLPGDKEDLARTYRRLADPTDYAIPVRPLNLNEGYLTVPTFGGPVEPLHEALQGIQNTNINLVSTERLNSTLNKALAIRDSLSIDIASISSSINNPHVSDEVIANARQVVENKQKRLSRIQERINIIENKIKDIQDSRYKEFTKNFGYQGELPVINLPNKISKTQAVDLVWERQKPVNTTEYNANPFRGRSTDYGLKDIITHEFNVSKEIDKYPIDTLFGRFAGVQKFTEDEMQDVRATIISKFSQALSTFTPSTTTLDYARITQDLLHESMISAAVEIGSSRRTGMTLQQIQLQLSEVMERSGKGPSKRLLQELKNHVERTMNAQISLADKAERTGVPEADLMDFLLTNLKRGEEFGTNKFFASRSDIEQAIKNARISKQSLQTLEPHLNALITMDGSNELDAIKTSVIGTSQLETAHEKTIKEGISLRSSKREAESELQKRAELIVNKILPTSSDFEKKRTIRQLTRGTNTERSQALELLKSNTTQENILSLDTFTKENEFTSSLIQELNAKIKDNMSAQSVTSANTVTKMSRSRTTAERQIPLLQEKLNTFENKFIQDTKSVVEQLFPTAPETGKQLIVDRLLNNNSDIKALIYKNVEKSAEHRKVYNKYLQNKEATFRRIKSVENRIASRERYIDYAENYIAENTIDRSTSEIEQEAKRIQQLYRTAQTKLLDELEKIHPTENVEEKIARETLANEMLRLTLYDLKKQKLSTVSHNATDDIKLITQEIINSYEDHLARILYPQVYTSLPAGSFRNPETRRRIFEYLAADVKPNITFDLSHGLDSNGNKFPNGGIDGFFKDIAVRAFDMSPEERSKAGVFTRKGEVVIPVEWALDKESKSTMPLEIRVRDTKTGMLDIRLEGQGAIQYRVNSFADNRMLAEIDNIQRLGDWRATNMFYGPSKQTVYKINTSEGNSLYGFSREITPEALTSQFNLIKTNPGKMIGLDIETFNVKGKETVGDIYFGDKSGRGFNAVTEDFLHYLDTHISTTNTKLSSETIAFHRDNIRNRIDQVFKHSRTDLSKTSVTQNVMLQVDKKVNDYIDSQLVSIFRTRVARDMGIPSHTLSIKEIKERLTAEEDDLIKEVTNFKTLYTRKKFYESSPKTQVFKNEDDILNAFAEHVEKTVTDKTTIIGHNIVQFDLPEIREKLGDRVATQLIENSNIIDTKDLAALFIDNPNHSKGGLGISIQAIGERLRANYKELHVGQSDVTDLFSFIETQAKRHLKGSFTIETVKMEGRVFFDPVKKRTFELLGTVSLDAKQVETSLGVKTNSQRGYLVKEFDYGTGLSLEPKILTEADFRGQGLLGEIARLTETQAENQFAEAARIQDSSITQLAVDKALGIIRGKNLGLTGALEDLDPLIREHARSYIEGLEKIKGSSAKDIQQYVANSVRQAKTIKFREELSSEELKEYRDKFENFIRVETPKYLEEPAPWMAKFERHEKIANLVYAAQEEAQFNKKGLTEVLQAKANSLLVSTDPVESFTGQYVMNYMLDNNNAAGARNVAQYLKLRDFFSEMREIHIPEINKIAGALQDPIHRDRATIAYLDAVYSKAPNILSEQHFRDIGNLNETLPTVPNLTVSQQVRLDSEESYRLLNMAKLREKQSFVPLPEFGRRESDQRISDFIESIHAETMIQKELPKVGYATEVKAFERGKTLTSTMTQIFESTPGKVVLGVGAIIAAGEIIASALHKPIQEEDPPVYQSLDVPSKRVEINETELAERRKTYYDKSAVIHGRSEDVNSKVKMIANVGSDKENYSNNISDRRQEINERFVNTPRNYKRS